MFLQALVNLVDIFCEEQLVDKGLFDALQEGRDFLVQFVRGLSKPKEVKIVVLIEQADEGGLPLGPAEPDGAEHEGLDFGASGVLLDDRLLGDLVVEAIEVSHLVFLLFLIGESFKVPDGVVHLVLVGDVPLLLFLFLLSS